jgi:shikimate kinase
MQKRYRALRTIALVGLPGSGKSSVGKSLAALLSCPFADCDVAISAAAGLTIPELFSQRGEGAFRALESRVLAELCRVPADTAASPQDADRLVLATGGGCVLSEGNRLLLRERCWVVWLDISPEAAARRLAASAGKAGVTGRPLLDGGNAAERLIALDRERRPLYEGLADMRVDAEGPAYEALARRVAQALGNIAVEDNRAALS